MLRVMVVDDHEVVRRGLTLILRAFEDFEVVGEAANGAEALSLCATAQPDVILLDVMMPEMDGITATRRIRQQYPQIQIVALTSAKDETTIREMLQAGAVGYLLKNAPIDDVAEAVRLAARGKLALAPEAAKVLLNPEPRPSPRQDYQLSARELEVLAYMVEGLNNIEIAAKLSVAHSTIKFHASSIFDKLNVSNRVEAVRIALEANLVKK